MVMICRIVDGHGGPLVLDLNGIPGGAAAGGALQRGLDMAEGQLASTVSSDVQWSPAASPSALGRRRITIPFVLRGSSPDDLGNRVAKLMLATRGPWWLRVRRTAASQDCWLRCFGAIPQVDSTRITGTSIPHVATGTITCDTDPYALGDRVDRSPASISMDPSGSAFSMDVDDVPGDTATPLLLRFHDSTAFSAPMGAFVGVRSRQIPSNLTASRITRQAQASGNALVNAPGVTMSVQSDAGYSGGQYVRALFSAGYAGGPENAASITFAAPTLSGPDAPGAYRMLMRIHRVGDAAAQQLVLRAFTNNSLITPEDIIVPANIASTVVVDLGLVQWPSAQPPMLAAPLPSVASSAAPTGVTVQFYRKSGGAAEVAFDYLTWIPADTYGGYLETDGSLFSPGSQYVIVDGYQHLASITSTDVIDGTYSLIGQAFGTVTPTARWTGMVPCVAPGDNRVFVVAGLSPDQIWPLSQPLNLRMSYWPRYTWLR